MEPAATTGRRPHALRLLSLDGGGIRGISELIILEEIMHRVQRAENILSAPLPADYFDLICGTSTGGLIALLLGRLRLSVPEAIDKYRQLAKQVFSEKKTFVKDGKFKASNLEKAIKEVVEWKLGKGREEERMFTSARDGCKAFVCAVPAMHVSREPKLFRTWSADKNPGYNCTIWEAGRATSAAPTFFKRICIGSHGMQEEFIDAGIGCNNPVQYLVQEAQREFGPEKDVACIVSIGTGKPKVAGFKAPGRFQRLLPLDLINVLKVITTDSETVASLMQTRYQHCDGLYHRLNVERGLEEVSLEEWEKLGEVKTHTMDYLCAKEISQRLDVIVNALLGKPARTFPLGKLDGTFQVEPSSRTHIVYPSYKVSHYVERKGLLEKINGELQKLRNASSPVVFVLLGMGGCGKSQLALEYCHQADHNRTYSVIFWIDATSPITAQQGFTTTAQAMSRPNFSVSDDEGNLQFVRSTLNSWHGKWLLVFDNYDDPKAFNNKDIKEYFPQRGQGSILITSRHEAAKCFGCHIDISAMSDGEALELLFRRSHVDQNEPNLREGQEITKRLGHHALAIDQAGAYILARNLDIKLYLTHYNSRRERVLSEAPELWDYKRKLKDNPETVTKLTVFTTWELSFDLITGDNTARKDKEHILTLIAFFDGRHLSDALFEPYATENSDWMTSCRKDHEWDKVDFQDILKELRNLSLLQSLQISEEGASFSLHPLIQDWIRLRASIKSLQSYAKEAVLILGASLAYRDVQNMPFETRQATLVHIEAVLINEQEYLDRGHRPTDLRFLDSLHEISFFLNHQGRYRIAEELGRVVLEQRKLLLGDEHHNTRSTMGNYAFSLRGQGRYNEAEPMYRQTLALNKKVHGKEHPNTLTSMNNLALLLKSQGKYDEAEPMYRQTLALSEKVLGKEHPDTLASLNNLASLLDSQGKYDEAEPMYRQILALREKVLGKKHPNTLASMNNLALLLKSQGKFDKAEPIYRQTLALREKVLGKEHPDTLASMNNLASLLESQSKYDEAKSVYCQALEGMEKVLGQGHPDTLDSMFNLADFLEKQNSLEEAEALFRRELRGCEIFYGLTHFQTIFSLRRFATLLEKMGKGGEADVIRQRLADIDKDSEKEDSEEVSEWENISD